MNRLTDPEIAEIEHKMGISLPSLYRKLLTEIGHGSFGQKPGSKSNTSKEIYHPEAVRDLYESFLEDPELLFAPYFPFGCDNRWQDIWIIDAKLEKAASISHDTHPDDWPEETWMEYDSWIERYIKNSESI